MTTIEAIHQHLQGLPKKRRQEVLEFVVFLETRRLPAMREEDQWSAMSLSSAMRGMEDEDSPFRPYAPLSSPSLRSVPKCGITAWAQ